MKIIIVIISLLLANCAHQTVHDYCMERLDHYSSYGECYSERSERLRTRRQALAHIGDGLQNSESQQYRPVQCTTTGMPGLYSTNCQ